MDTSYLHRNTSPNKANTRFISSRLSNPTPSSLTNTRAALAKSNRDHETPAEGEREDSLDTRESEREISSRLVL